MFIRMVDLFVLEKVVVLVMVVVVVAAESGKGSGETLVHFRKGEVVVMKLPKGGSKFSSRGMSSRESNDAIVRGGA